MSNSIQFNETFYLSTYPDVASAVSRGQFTSGQQHYNSFGRFESRNPNAFFNTAEYLGRYPDVAAAGVNPFQHFLLSGAREGRLPNNNADSTIDVNNDNVGANDFNSAAYVAQYPDVGTAVTAGQLTAYQHFILFGQFEGRTATLNNGTTFTGSFANGGSGPAANPGTPGAPTTGTPGQTFTLTTGTDTGAAFTGSTGNDTFNADQKAEGGLLLQTLNSNDSINGGAGVDTLNATIKTSVAPTSLAGIEVVSVTSVDDGNGGTAPTITLTNAADLTTIRTSGNGDSEGVAFLGVQKALTGGIQISNNSTNVTVTSAAAALSGTTDALTIGLTSVTGGALTVDTTGANGYETVTLNSIGSVANTLTSFTDGAATSLSTLKVLGTQDLTITNTLEAEVKTIDATGFTGKLNVTSTGTAVLTVTGGSGNDTFVLGANYIGGTAGDTRDIINGGGGIDTLSVTTAVATAITVAQSNLTSIETLAVSDKLGDTADAAADNVDLTKFTGVTRLELAGANADAHTFTINSGTTIASSADFDSGSANTFTIAGAGTTDSLTLELASSVDFLGAGVETFNGVETLNIKTAAAAGTVNIFANDVTLTPTAATEKIVASGATALTFSGTITADEIDATGLSGVLTLTAGTAGATIITGGTAADLLKGSSAGDIIKGGGGADVFTSTAGTDILTGDAGSDIFYYAASTHNGQTITDFAAGTGGDVLRIDDSGFGNLTGTNALAFKKIGTGVASAATTDNVLVVTDAVVNGTSAAAVEDAVLAAGGGTTNFSAGAVTYVVFNSATSRAELYFDTQGATDNNGTDIVKIATFDNITSLAGVQALIATNFDVVA